MLVKLKAPHIINDLLRPANTIMQVSTVTPLMEPLDTEAAEAIRVERIRVFGRWVGRWPNLHLLEDPPLERPLEDNRPVPPVGVGVPR